MIDVRHDDCLNAMRDIPDGSIDAVICDPPYFLPARHYQTRREFPRSLTDLSMLEHFYRDWFAESARILKPTGTMYVFCDGQSYPLFFTVAYRYVRKMVPLVWDKVNSINGYSWRHQHELILFAQMDESPNVPTGDGDILRCRAVPVDSRAHPAEKPVELLERLITKSVPAGGVVLDSFMGSGTTGVACIETGRNFIGIEKDATYFAVAEQRLADAAAKLHQLELTV